MDEIELAYKTISPQREERNNKLQLILASIGILAGYSEGLDAYNGFELFIPIMGLLIALLNILFAIFYKSLVKKYDQKFERLLLRVNGLLFLLTGISFQIDGTKYIHFAYYLLAIMYAVVLPDFILPRVSTHRKIKFNQAGIVIKKRFKTIQYSWQNIQSILLEKDMLKIQFNGKKRVKKYYIDLDNDTETYILQLIASKKLLTGNTLGPGGND